MLLCKKKSIPFVGFRIGLPVNRLRFVPSSVFREVIALDIK